jgi:hypothetical protein
VVASLNSTPGPRPGCKPGSDVCSKQTAVIVSETEPDNMCATSHISSRNGAATESAIRSLTLIDCNAASQSLAAATARYPPNMYGAGSESQDELSRPDLAIMSAGGQQLLLR